jgi:hypothetical protein
MNKVLLLLVTMLVGLLGLTGAASAATGFTNLGVFAQAPADSQAAHQHRIAVNHTSGDVYVTDVVNDRIDVYRPSVAGDSAAALTTFGTGELTNPYGIAIDQSTGDVYVSDATRVVRYTSDNAPTPAFTKDNTFTSPSVTGPLAFDAANDQLVVGDTANNTVRRYEAAGTPGLPGATFDGSAGAGSPGAFVGLEDLAVDSTGDVIVVDATGNPGLDNGSVSRVERFASSGDWEATVGPVPGAATVAVRGGDELIVSDRQNSVFFGEHATLHRFAADGTALDDMPSGALTDYSIVSGIASDDGANGRTYVATDNGDYNGDYSYGNPSIQVFQAFPAADATVSTPTGVTATAATLHGTINPQGGPGTTGYHFEYSSDNAITWISTPAQDAGGATTDVAVTATLSGLTPGVAYRVRLVAAKSGATTTSDAVSFAADTIAPAVTTGQATQIDSTSAELNATINPHGAATRFYAEYGTTTAYGSRYPGATGSSAGTGTIARAVSLTVSGLQPSTAYHYRVVATNTHGTVEGNDQTLTTKASPDNNSPDSCPNAAIRATQHVAFLPECRAYEMVSPVDKGGADVGMSNTVQTTASGDAALFSSTNGFPGTPLSTVENYFRADRTDTSWGTESIEPPTHNTANFLLYTSRATSADLAATLQVSRVALAPGAVEGAGNIYLRDNRTGRRKLIASGPPKLLNAVLGPNNVRFGDGTPTFDYVVFTSIAKLTDDAIDGVGNIYKYSTGAGLRLVDVLPDGTTDPAGGSMHAPEATRSHGAISDDGRRIVFGSNTTGGLYLREGDTTTAISVSQRSGDPDTPQPAQFISLAPDGSQVYFLSDELLTEDSTASLRELYRYDVASGKLTDLTVTTDPADAPTGANVMRVLSINGSGDRIYFEATANLAAGASTAGPKLYVWSPGGTKFIAALDPSEFSSPGSWSTSSSGRFLAFSSFAPVTGYDGRGPSCAQAPDGRCGQVFVYDDHAQSIRCASCDPAGLPANSTVGGVDSTISGYYARAVTDDGRVFFNSDARLVAGDTNGRADVYEWDGSGPRLISTGKSSSDSVFADSSVDGSTAFFSTAEALVSQDVDTNVDLYAARVDGGLGAQNKVPVPEVPCREDGCQGRPSSPPGSVVVGSVTFAGEGNPPFPGAPRAKVAGPKVTKPKTITGASARLQVKVPAKGRIAVTGSGLSGSAATVGKAGTYRITVRLSRIAQRALKRKHRLTVQATVRFTSSGGAARSVRVPLTFKTATTAKEGRS